MRYKKLSLLLVVSLVFFLAVSLILICAWFYYYFYDNNNVAVKGNVKDSIAQQRSHDSLQRMYTASIGTFDSSAMGIGNDSLRADFNSKLAEFYQLRNEITSILRNRTTPNDLERAREKIGTLQMKIDELRNRTIRVEYENKKLNAMLMQLSNELRGQESTSRKMGQSIPKTVTEKQNAHATISVSDVRLAAYSNEDKESETTSADQTGRLSGSFNIRTNTGNSRGEIMIVIIQPDGRVFQGSGWESGSFETPDGKKIYSAKIVFDAGGSDSRRLTFSVRGDEFQPGEYSVLIYYNGSVLGRGSRALQ